MKIDGVAVEPSPADDPDAMGLTALDIDCDLDALALKMVAEVKVEDFKTVFGGRIRSCFTGRDAVGWCMSKQICSDELDAVHLLNRMIRRGLMHHHSLNKLMENSPSAYYRFPQDHFKLLVDQTGGTAQSMRHKLRPRAKTLHGEAALQERWYADVPTLPLDKIRNLGVVLQRLTSRDLQRGLRRHYSVFYGREAVQVLIESGVAKDVTDALAIGNAFLRAGLFHHVHLKAPLRDDDTLYRLAKLQYEIIMSRDHTAHMSNGGRAYNADGGMDESRVGVVLGTSRDLKDVLDAQGRSALELATSSRYWTSYRASKLYALNLTVVEGFIDMSDDWDSHVDELFPTYCECYLTREKDATAHRTNFSQKSLHPNVDYLDAIRIDLKAHTNLGNDINIGSLEFAAHEVMGAREEPIVVEFDCGSRQFAECAAAILKVRFDPAVAGPAESGEGSKHHHILTNGVRSKEDLAQVPDMSRRGGGGATRSQMRRSLRGSIRRTSLGTTAGDIDPVYINVEGPNCCILLDDDSARSPVPVDSFTGLALGLMSGSTSVVRTSGGTSIRSSLHSLQGWWDPDRVSGMNAGTGTGATINGRRASVTSSEAGRGSQQSDLADINEDNEFHGPLPAAALQEINGNTSDINGASTSSNTNNVYNNNNNNNALHGNSLDNNGTGSDPPGTMWSAGFARVTSGVVGGGARGGGIAEGGGGASGTASQRTLRRTSWDPQVMRTVPVGSATGGWGSGGVGASGGGGVERETGRSSTASRRLSWGPTPTSAPAWTASKRQ